jgi:hypothetical protein
VSATVGTYPIVASAATGTGLANYSITYANGKLTVNKANTTTALTSTANPVVLGQAVTFTATVATVAPGGGTPTGNVVFKDGATVLATVLLVNGVATFSTSTLSQATHSINAAYQGDANHVASTPATLNEQIQSATTVALTSSAASGTSNAAMAMFASANISQGVVQVGTPVTFTATVADVAPGTGVPTGTVTFYDGTTQIGTGTLVNGVATLALSTLAAGSHSIKAVYGGDTAHAASTSATITQAIA